MELKKWLKCDQDLLWFPALHINHLLDIPEFCLTMILCLLLLQVRLFHWTVHLHWKELNVLEASEP